MKKAIGIQLMAYGDSIGETIEYAKMNITRFYGYRKRAFDKDNLYGSAKILIDAMRQLEIIKEDTPAHLELTVDQEKSPDKTTFVRITVEERE